MSAGRRLVRALQASAAAAGCSVRVSVSDERPWSSATFVGARYDVVIAGQPTPTLAAWLDGLVEAPPVLPGHVVADMRVDRIAGGARLGALTLEA